jgi:hypothetical protein
MFKCLRGEKRTLPPLIGKKGKARQIVVHTTENSQSQNTYSPFYLYPHPNFSSPLLPLLLSLSHTGSRERRSET